MRLEDLHRTAYSLMGCMGRAGSDFLGRECVWYSLFPKNRLWRANVFLPERIDHDRCVQTCSAAFRAAAG